jgi:hypothetical protein
MATASIKAVRELGSDGMANIGALLLNVVRKEQAKDAERLEPKRHSGPVGELKPLPSQTTRPPADKQSLTHPGVYAERGKPVRCPHGKASRKASPSPGGYRRREQAKVVL